MHIEFNATEYLERLRQRGVSDNTAIELLKDEQNRFEVIEKAIEQSKKEIKSEIEAKQLATKDDIQIAKLELQKEILAIRKDLENLRIESKKDIETLKADIIDKINSSNKWIISTILISFMMMSMPKILESIHVLMK